MSDTPIVINNKPKPTEESLPDGFTSVSRQWMTINKRPMNCPNCGRQVIDAGYFERDSVVLCPGCKWWWLVVDGKTLECTGPPPEVREVECPSGFQEMAEVLKPTCPFDIDGECTAMACFSSQGCGAKDDNGSPQYSENKRGGVMEDITDNEAAYRDALEAEYEVVCEMREEIHRLEGEILQTTELLKKSVEAHNRVAAECDRYREALEHITLYVAYNGDTWPADRAREALEGSGT